VIPVTRMDVFASSSRSNYDAD